MVTTPSYVNCTNREQRSLTKYAAWKHGGEVHWVRQIQNLSKQQAHTSLPGLYVLAVHPGWVSRNRRCTQEFNEVIAHARSMSEFERYSGRRHVVLFTDYGVNRSRFEDFTIATQTLQWYPNKKNVVVAPMHTSFHDGRLSIQRAVNIRKNATSPRRFLFSFVGQADNRVAYRSRRSLIAALQILKSDFPQQVNIHISNLSKTSWLREYPEVLGKTLFGVSPRGDLPSSNRLYDGLSLACIPIILSDTFFKYTCPGLGIPWQDFVYQLKERVAKESVHVYERKLAERLRWAAYDTEGVKRRQRELGRWVDRLLWQSPNSLVAETMLLDIEKVLSP